MQNLERLAKQELVSEEFLKDFDGLLDEEQDALKNCAWRSKFRPLTGKLLRQRHDQTFERTYDLFSPLFGYWLK